MTIPQPTDSYIFITTPNNRVVLGRVVRAMALMEHLLLLQFETPDWLGHSRYNAVYVNSTETHSGSFSVGLHKRIGNKWLFKGGFEWTQEQNGPKAAEMDKLFDELPISDKTQEQGAGGAASKTPAVGKKGK